MAARKYRFERLTPIDNMDLNVYEEAIDYVFSNSDVKNVAISGAYSAGKSSVLASYKKKHGELRFLHISLAHFKSTDQESDAEVKESTLEGKILNQLIHQIPSEKIPQTNFRVKKTVSSKSIATSTIGAVLFLISILHLLFFSVWKNYISVLPVSLIKSILMPSTHPYALIVDGIIILVLLSLSVHKLIRIQREKNIFRKLNIKGNEIEIFEKSDDSYFDKYLNEVLYLFENADADVIVFEDMDRFNTNGIFERLREVNTLANIQLNKKNEKVLRFFYLLRDDIFDSKDRTKFFDYIIPVVPVVDGSNSYDQFISQLKSAGTFEKFDKSFLQGLSLYIDDMRLLKNIYNEFVIYYNRLNITELDCNKMLAIIAYKNLFPRDFADLQLNQGFVYTLFSKKGKFVENEVSEIEREIEEIRNKISSYKNEHLMSMRELNVVFADKYLSNYNWLQKSDNDLSEFVTDRLSGNTKDEYLHRRQMLREKLDGNSDKLSQEILRLEQNIVELNDKHLHQIITRENIDMQKAITINSKEISLLKPITAADYKSKTILTDSAWEYVELWFKRQKDEQSKNALFYWQQAKHFFLASEKLPQNSKPLTSYYCCLNATKALLCVNGINVTNISHGITQARHEQVQSNSLDKAEVIFLGSGVLNELSRYLGENVDKQTHNIKDLLYNIPCVHRSFAITYTGTTELFVPIRNLKFIREDTTSKAWVQFDLDARYANASILRYLPAGYKKVPPNPESNTYTIRKENSRFNWNIHSDLNQRMQDLSNYHRKVRKDLFYIYGDTKLWYLKKNLPNNTHVLQRNSLTLIFAVMHWMSELVRYNPQKFEKLMESKQNWLLHEFIEKALYQFVDEISCEITHQEIMTTGYRK